MTTTTGTEVDLHAVRARRHRALHDEDRFAASELVHRDVPALVAEVEALRAQVQRVRDLASEGSEAVACVGWHDHICPAQIRHVLDSGESQ